jgi:hypothetical protein
MKNRDRKRRLNALGLRSVPRRKRYCLAELLKGTERFALTDEMRAWDNMAPVGREFGSPDFERLAKLDNLAADPPNNLKVFLDDARAAPPGWAGVCWPSEVIQLLETGHVTEISLDHDLGDDARGTGYDVDRGGGRFA